MYGFLILLPLTLISLLIGSVIATSPQVADYVAYVTDISGLKITLDEVWSNKRAQLQIAAHALSYIVLCFAAMATVRTISNPLPADRPAGLRYFQIVLEAIFVSVPSSVLLWISLRALSGDWHNWVQLGTVVMLCIGIIVTISITVLRRPLELYESSLTPFSFTLTDIFAFLSAIVIGIAVAAFALKPIEAAYAVGMFPVLMLTTAATLLVLAAIFSRWSSPVAVISTMITCVVLLNIVDQVTVPTREFRYKTIASKAMAAPSEVAIADVKAQRAVPDLATAFLQWLEHRRPAIEEYKKKGRLFPVFFISAQGGGVYAAYHPALSLARLSDQCPEFARHIFGVSSVSGGSLGAAVYAELLRTLPAKAPYDPANAHAGCTPTGGPTVDNLLQTRVHDFFQTDFLSPVIASAFLFDIPSMFIPQLRFGQDRAKALEHGFETAWQKLKVPGDAGGLAADFYDRWSPKGLAPALFMSTTGVNFGIPVIVSQVDWSFSPSSVVGRRRGDSPEAATRSALPSPGLVQTVRERLQSTEDGPQVGIANMLDFRPDIQLTTSTAVVLSARFPFVTPPGAIVENAKIARRGLYQKTKVLELTDGAFYDNSGAIVARDVLAELLRRLRNDTRFKDFKDSVKLNLIRFTDTPAKRQSDASQSGHFELLTPLVAYDAVRQARGVILANPSREVGVYNIYLLDEWFEGTLNWLLSEKTKEAIEKRSSWLVGYENEVCCEVRDPDTKRFKRIPLTEEQEAELAKSDLKATRFVPNVRPFRGILDLVENGASPTPAASPAPPSPPGLSMPGTPAPVAPGAPPAPAPQAPSPTAQ